MCKFRTFIFWCITASMAGFTVPSRCNAQAEAVVIWIGEKIASKLFDKGWNALTGTPDPAEIAQDLKELEAEFRKKDSIYAYEIARLRQDQALSVKRDEVKRIVDLALKDLENRMTSLEQRQRKVSELLDKMEKPLGIILNEPPAPPKLTTETVSGSPGSHFLMREYGPLLVQSHNALQGTKALLAQGFPQTSSKVQASLQAEKEASTATDALLAKATTALQSKLAELVDLQKEYPVTDPRIHDAQVEVSHLRWLVSMLSPALRDTRGTLLLPLEFLRADCSDLLASLINSGVKPETLVPLFRDLLSHPLTLKPEPLAEPAELAPHHESFRAVMTSAALERKDARRVLNKLTAALKTSTEEGAEVQALRTEEKALLASLGKIHDASLVALDAAVSTWIGIIKIKRQNATPLLQFRAEVLQPLYQLTLASQPCLSGRATELSDFLSMEPQQKVFTLAIPADETGKSASMTLVPIPLKNMPFLMGSPKSEPGRHPNEDQTEVTLTQPYYMLETEVTQAQWQAVMERTEGQRRDVWSTHAQFRGPNRPMDYVSWSDCVAFCTKLNALCANQLPPGYHFDLPTEAQWEYAARAGSAKPFSIGNDGYHLTQSDAQFGWPMHLPVNGGKGTVNVKTFTANAFGLYDMHGNVWEWCRDAWDPSTTAKMPAGLDPISTVGHSRIQRGGSWCSPEAECRASARALYTTPEEFYHTGTDGKIHKNVPVVGIRSYSERQIDSGFRVVLDQ